MPVRGGALVVPPLPSDDRARVRVQLRRSGTYTFRPATGAEDPALLYAEMRANGRWFPWLIPSFLVINLAMFVIVMFVNNCPKNSLNCAARVLGRFAFQPISENPLVGPSSTTLENMGALDVGKVIHGHQGWRLVTCMWLHGGVLHLLANMLSLLVIGIRVEQEFGFVRTGLLYLISGFGGSLLSALFLRSNISVGASGALFGLLGGMLSELITNWSIYTNKVLSLVTLVVIVVINLAVGILPHVDNFAHIGGFLSGFLLGFVFLVRPQFGWVAHRYNLPGHPSLPESKFKKYQYILWIISLILLILGFVVALLMLFRGVDLNERCTWCHYMSCVPTKKWSCSTEPASCQSDENGDQYLLTCIGRNNGTAKSYTLKDPTSTVIQGLCTQLCR